MWLAQHTPFFHQPQLKILVWSCQLYRSLPLRPYGVFPCLTVLKVVFFMSVMPVRQVLELTTLSCKEPFIVLYRDKMVLRPQASFLPKWVSPFSLISTSPFLLFVQLQSIPKRFFHAASMWCAQCGFTSWPLIPTQNSNSLLVLPAPSRGILRIIPLFLSDLGRFYLWHML